MTYNSLTKNEEHNIPPTNVEDHFRIVYLVIFRPQYVSFPVRL